MPELTWTTALAWFGVLAGAASVAALILGLIGTWQTKRLQADIHMATQTTLGDLAKGFRESQQSLGQILERMDQRADDRQREMIQAIQALKG
jgi:cytochrome oxidase assembly protein ShyY1